MTTITRERNYAGCNPSIVAAFDAGRDILCSVWDDHRETHVDRWVIYASDGMYQDEQGVWWDEASPVDSEVK